MERRNHAELTAAGVAGAFMGGALPRSRPVREPRSPARLSAAPTGARVPRLRVLLGMRARP